MATMKASLHLYYLIYVKILVGAILLPWGSWVACFDF